MLNRLKRYWVAFLSLFLVILFMLGGTLAVKHLGDSILADVNTTMKPKGERLVL